jgi:hypothetical protein
VTRCGFGDSGQKQILERLVNALPALYSQVGLRGVSLRNGGPAPEYRYMGHNNEGMFNYTGKPGEAEVQRALGVVAAHLESLGAPAPTTTSTSATWAPVFKPGPNQNDHWVEVFVDGAHGVLLVPEGQRPVWLEKKSWGSFALSRATPTGIRLRLVAYRAPKGAWVLLRASRSDGERAVSTPHAWLVP